MFKFMFSLFFFATAVFAQGVVIGQPTYNQTVGSGSQVVVQVQRPNTLTGSEEVAVVIGMQSCPNSPCTSPTENMGIILYNGPFNPAYYEANLPPYQNFTVQVPSTLAAGAASVGVAHFTLVGAGLTPVSETLNQTINVSGN